MLKARALRRTFAHAARGTAATAALPQRLRLRAFGRPQAAAVIFRPQRMVEPPAEAPDAEHAQHHGQMHQRGLKEPVGREDRENGEDRHDQRQLQQEPVRIFRAPARGRAAQVSEVPGDGLFKGVAAGRGAGHGAIAAAARRRRAQALPLPVRVLPVRVP